MHRKNNNTLKIAIINGPNINLTGQRDPQIYGTQTIEQTITKIKQQLPHIEIIHFQSNSEGQLIDAIQKYGFCKQADAIIINPGAYAHYSYAIADAIKDSRVPIIEIHISNIFAREPHRQKSITATHAKALITGLGTHGYIVAATYLAQHAKN